MRHLYRALVVVLPLVSIAILLGARRAQTIPLYAARTGNLCQTCHFDPNGGGARNAFGFAYAKKRHSMEDEPDTTGLWHGLDLTNRIGDTMPVYIGLNYRLMLITNTTNQTDSLDRFGFFEMENALHVAFQPHSRLTFLYSTPQGQSGGDALGIIGGFPWGGYIKGGSFRVPFGLRMDDHTVATRNSFLDFRPNVPGGSPISGQGASCRTIRGSWTRASSSAPSARGCSRAARSPTAPPRRSERAATPSPRPRRSRSATATRTTRPPSRSTTPSPRARPAARRAGVSTR